MSADAGGVRLSKHAPSVWVESQIGNHIAYPAAQAAAMEAVVLAATRLSPRLTSYSESDVLDDFKLAVEAYLSTLPRAHGGEGGG